MHVFIFGEIPIDKILVIVYKIHIFTVEDSRQSCLPKFLSLCFFIKHLCQEKQLKTHNE